MSSENKQPPAKVHGLKHLIVAIVYSIGGLKRLVWETAFRLQCLAYVLVQILLVGLDAGLNDYVISFVLFMMLISVEALNTAIEVIVDKISPEWSVMARDAKDLGSFAALCMYLAHGGFLVVVIYRFVTSTV